MTKNEKCQSVTWDPSTASSTPSVKPRKAVAKKAPPSLKIKAKTKEHTVTPGFKVVRRLHWSPLAYSRIQGTIWESISQRSPSRLRSSIYESPSVHREDLAIPKMLIESFFRKCNPETMIEDCSIVLPESHKRSRKGPVSILEGSRFRSVAVCLKGLQLEGPESVNRIIKSLKRLCHIYETSELGTLTAAMISNLDDSRREGICGAETIKRVRRCRILTRDELRMIMDCFPTAEEKIRLAAVPSGLLDPLDAAMLSMASEFELKLKMEVLLSRASVEIEAHRVCSKLLRIKEGVDALKLSLESGHSLVRVLELVLEVGNFLNYGSYNGGAHGFRVDSLLLLGEYRVDKINLLNVLASWTWQSYGKDPQSRFFTELKRLTSALKMISTLDLDNFSNEISDLAASVTHSHRAIMLLNEAAMEMVEEAETGISANEIVSLMQAFVPWSRYVVNLFLQFHTNYHEQLFSLCKTLGEPEVNSVASVIKSLYCFLQEFSCAIQNNERRLIPSLLSQIVSEDRSLRQMVMTLCHHEEAGYEVYWADDTTTVKGPFDEQRSLSPCWKSTPNVRTSPEPLVTRGQIRPKWIKKTVCVEIRVTDSQTDCPACMYISMEKKLRRTHELLEYLPAGEQKPRNVFRCALFNMKKLLSKFKRMIIPEIDIFDSLWPTCEKENILTKLRKSRLPNNYVVFGDKAIRHEVPCVS